MNTTKVISTLLVILFASSVYTQDCNTELITTMLGASTENSAKIVESEPAYTAVTPLATLATSGWEAGKMCADLWTAQGGSCCAQADLIARLKVLIEKQKKRAKDMKGKLDNGSKNVSGKSAETKARLATEAAKPANAGAKATAINNAIAAIAKVETAVAGTEATLVSDGKAKMQKCLAAIANLRGKAWCTICMKRAASPVDTTALTVGDAFKIDVDSCKTLAESCGKPMAMLKKITAIADSLKQVKSAMAGGASPPPRPIPTNAEIDAVAQCTGDDCKNDTAKRQAFCGQIGINNDNQAVVGDSTTVSTTVTDAVGARRLLTSEPRILAFTANSMTAETSGSVNYSTMNANFQVTEGQLNDSFAKQVVTGLLVVLAITSGLF